MLQKSKNTVIMVNSGKFIPSFFRKGNHMSATRGILIPSDQLNERLPDPAFTLEVEVARAANIPITLCSPWTLSETSEVKFRNLPEPGSVLFYRGWMLTVEEYENVFASLKRRNITLITTPENYASAHHLPGWYDIFQNLTPKSIVLPKNPSTKTILDFGKQLGASAFIVKDFVKSRKYEWDTACYSPDLLTLPSIVNEFIRLQEDDGYLTGSVVLREFVKLDSHEGEVRVWWANFEPVLMTMHPDYTVFRSTMPEVEISDELRAKVQELGNPFITTDLAPNMNGNWVVIEVGDGQVSGLAAETDEESTQKLFEAILKPFA